MMLEDVRRRSAEFEILHFHTELLHFPVFHDMAARTVMTLHGRLDLQPFHSKFPDFPLVSISNDQRRPLPPVNWVGTVYHGLPPDLLRFEQAPAGDYLAFLGRISPEKHPDRAIEIARRANLRIRVAAKVDDANCEYFEKIRPLFRDPLAESIGEIDDAHKSDFLGNARALLFPIDWPEPFGLVMIEAMACGTPVIAFARGSVSEVIEEGVTGFLVNNIDEAVEAIGQLQTLDRCEIRHRFEQRFSVTRMARDYVEIYQRLARPSTRRLRIA